MTMNSPSGYHKPFPHHRWRRSLTLAFLSLLLSACTIADDAESAPPEDDSANRDKTGRQAAEIDTAEADSAEIQAGPRALSRAFRMAARKATPSVVTILSYGQETVLRNRRARQQGQAEDDAQKTPAQTDKNQLTGLGSGVIVSHDGMVITNNHVITEAKRVVVQLPDDTEIEATDVRGDPDSDVATLRIARDEGFDFAELGDAEALEIGDWVLSIGSPFRLEATVSAGIISAKNRTLRRINRGRLIQTDAAINPGNSGGPLIDLDGRVIAISTAIATRTTGYQGIGFAIPINQARWIADELANHGQVRRAAIGIRMAELNPKIASKFNLPTGLGVLAYQVIENSAAERAGIKPLDVIMEFAGERVRDPGTLQEAIERKQVGSFQEVKVYRSGEEMMLKVELATLEDPTLQKTKPEQEGEEQQESGNRGQESGSEQSESNSS
jgi:serine protease Do